MILLKDNMKIKGIGKEQSNLRGLNIMKKQFK